jgi:hypothetical protein
MVAFASIVCGTLLVSTIVVSIARVIGRRRLQVLPDASVARIEERLSRIEQAIDAMAVEVERVSEGQRFTTKLLADRPAERT